MRFKDKVVLITGAGSGIGRAVALGFAREGAQVVVTGRRRGPLDHTVKLIEADGGHGAAIPADVTRSQEVRELVDEIVRRYGRLDIAVNNAGVLFKAEVADIDEDDWARTLDTNVTGVMLSMKHEIAAMLRTGSGVIINVSSQLGAHIRIPGLGAYAASKAAVTALTRTAAKEYARHGIRVNTVSPGPHDTPMSMRPGETEDDRAERVRRELPIGRVGKLDEITSGVLWLASDGAGFAVGTDLVLDGGSTA
ncbi:short-chain dehydrogenase [Sphaerisporangium krabiense]|uniref:NAD(P)-dependent dehydrogenase (Short-subunit alcohol dehydrogenase family) n=1 Tax=Sphaerisporangium krabiense TaxID=763782 RepID=A0A7W9DPG0_9ACTN|nr:glucose 1-dehydrogenase [Sphaerisporangium krabiense]MBB5626391.1 NAD(P)-dependent dehydrogenase (short-subunit alcohol dehydrogenase family) [Sphaerisporangium krabiense]GII63309.1 short-chain dehydrogenase [Sphaerisporangium krabiense]